MMALSRFKSLTPPYLFECCDTLLKSIDHTECVGQTGSRKPHSNKCGYQCANLDGFALVLRPVKSLLQGPLKNHVDEEPAHDRRNQHHDFHAPISPPCPALFIKRPSFAAAHLQELQSCLHLPVHRVDQVHSGNEQVWVSLIGPPEVLSHFGNLALDEGKAGIRRHSNGFLRNGIHDPLDPRRLLFSVHLRLSSWCCRSC